MTVEYNELTKMVFQISLGDEHIIIQGTIMSKSLSNTKQWFQTALLTINSFHVIIGDESLTQDDNLDNSSNTTATTETTEGVRERTLLRERRKMKLIEKYSSGQNSQTYNADTMKSLNNAIRKILIPRMKFVSTNKQFGQFEQPDFSDEHCWIHRVFEQLGTLKHASDYIKAEIWMMYRSKVKEQFSIHRATVTKNLKTVFLKGK